MSAAGLPPWLRPQVTRVAEAARAGRLHHALLVTGPAGVGKSLLADHLAACLLCEAGPPAGDPCGECRSCRLLAAGNHPDLRRVEPEEGRRGIVVDQVRDLIAYVALTAQYGTRKVVVLAPAEAMNRASANSLLKTLEEPPGDRVFILVSHQAGRLAATIRSRCQPVPVVPPAAEAAGAWVRAALDCDAGVARTLLDLAHGAPLLAVRYAAEDGPATRGAVLDDVAALVLGGAEPVATAERWRKLGAATVAFWLDAVLRDVIRVKSVPGAGDGERALQGLAEALDFPRLFGLADLCMHGRWAISTGANPNEHLLAEDLAVACARAGMRGGGEARRTRRQE